MSEPWPPSIPHPLMVRAHTLEPRSTVTVFETMRYRVRREFTDPMEMIEYTWNFTEDQFETFRDYVEINLENGQNNFLIGGFEGGQLVLRSVAFLSSGQPYTIGRSDNLFVVTAIVQVMEQES